MKPIEIDNQKLVELITSKDDEVTKGRALTVEIEKVEKKIEMYEKREKKITAAVAPDPELKKEGDALAQQVEAIMTRLQEIGNAINKAKLDAIPKDLELEHKAALKEKETLERDRNKCALRIQKIKDKVIPIIQKECKPLLKEFDDIETAQVKNGKVFVTTFNHLADWTRKFKAK